MPSHLMLMMMTTPLVNRPKFSFVGHVLWNAAPLNSDVALKSKATTFFAPFQIKTKNLEKFMFCLNFLLWIDVTNSYFSSFQKTMTSMVDGVFFVLLFFYFIFQFFIFVNLNLCAWLSFFHVNLNYFRSKKLSLFFIFF